MKHLNKFSEHQKLNEGNLDELKNKRFVLPSSIGNKAFFIEAEIRFVKNQNHPKFGMVSISTDSHWQPLDDLINDQVNGRHMSYEKANNILSDLGFIEVSDDFDQYDIESIRTIKPQLSKEWIDNYNLWVNYTG